MLKVSTCRIEDVGTPTDPPRPERKEEQGNGAERNQSDICKCSGVMLVWTGPESGWNAESRGSWGKGGTKGIMLALWPICLV